jgi:hypothetical protein
MWIEGDFARCMFGRRGIHQTTRSLFLDDHNEINSFFKRTKRLVFPTSTVCLKGAQKKENSQKSNRVSRSADTDTRFTTSFDVVKSLSFSPRVRTSKVL